MATPGLDTAQFCETLYGEACELARKRLGVLPKAGTIQMADLITAFVDLKKGAYAPFFGHIDGEWNDAFTIAKTYIHATDGQKVLLLPDRGYAIATIIESWNLFQQLPVELQQAVKARKEGFLNTQVKLHDRLSHFFNEKKVHMHRMDSKEREEVSALLALFQPQFDEACRKEDNAQVLALFTQLEPAIHRLELQYPSQHMKNFATKTHHDIMTMGMFLSHRSRL